MEYKIDVEQLKKDILKTFDADVKAAGGEDALGNIPTRIDFSRIVLEHRMDMVLLEMEKMTNCILSEIEKLRKEIVK